MIPQNQHSAGMSKTSTQINSPHWPLTDLAASLPASVPFIGPETIERQTGIPFAARLGANEQRFGPSPLAVRAMAQAAGDAWMYGDPENHDLKAALAMRQGCTPAHIVLGEGVDGLLGLIVRLCVAAGDAVVTSRGTYPTFNYHVTGFGGALHLAPYAGDASDPQALVDLAHRVGAKLVYIANPDNPMGSHHSADAIRAMLDALPPQTLLILDEAYIEFAPTGTAPDIAPDDPRLIRFRSFSKAYGLAGIRLGYGICAPDLARAFDRVRNHFGLGRIVQAGGLAALGDTAHLAHVLAGSVAARARIAQIADENGLRALPSATNFTCVDLGRDGADTRRVLENLAQGGIFVRMPSAAPQDRCLRISHGTAADLVLLAQALPRAL
jgi:histidinol-phosphate aminotransferase